MLRLGVQSDLDPEVAEALLLYFARHRDDSGANRDKTDLVATFLFRHPRVAGQWSSAAMGLTVRFLFLRLKSPFWKSRLSPTSPDPRKIIFNYYPNSLPFPTTP